MQRFQDVASPLSARGVDRVITGADMSGIWARVPGTGPIGRFFVNKATAPLRPLGVGKITRSRSAQLIARPGLAQEGNLLAKALQPVGGVTHLVAKAAAKVRTGPGRRIRPHLSIGGKSKARADMWSSKTAEEFIQNSGITRGALHSHQRAGQWTNEMYHAVAGMRHELRDVVEAPEIMDDLFEVLGGTTNPQAQERVINKIGTGKLEAIRSLWDNGLRKANFASLPDPTQVRHNLRESYTEVYEQMRAATLPNSNLTPEGMAALQDTLLKDFNMITTWRIEDWVPMIRTNEVKNILSGGEAEIDRLIKAAEREGGSTSFAQKLKPGRHFMGEELLDPSKHPTGRTIAGQAYDIVADRARTLGPEKFDQWDRNIVTATEVWVHNTSRWLEKSSFENFLSGQGLLARGEGSLVHGSLTSEVQNAVNHITTQRMTSTSIGNKVRMSRLIGQAQTLRKAATSPRVKKAVERRAAQVAAAREATKTLDQATTLVTKAQDDIDALLEKRLKSQGLDLTTQDEEYQNLFDVLVDNHRIAQDHMNTAVRGIDAVYQQAEQLIKTGDTELATRLGLILDLKTRSQELFELHQARIQRYTTLKREIVRTDMELARLGRTGEDYLEYVTLKGVVEENQKILLARLNTQVEAFQEAYGKGAGGQVGLRQALGEAFGGELPTQSRGPTDVISAVADMRQRLGADIRRLQGEVGTAWRWSNEIYGAFGIPAEMMNRQGFGALVTQRNQAFNIPEDLSRIPSMGLTPDAAAKEFGLTANIVRGVEEDIGANFALTVKALGSDPTGGELHYLGLNRRVALNGLAENGIDSAESAKLYLETRFAQLKALHAQRGIFDVHQALLTEGVDGFLKFGGIDAVVQLRRMAGGFDPNAYMAAVEARGLTVNGADVAAAFQAFDGALALVDDLDRLPQHLDELGARLEAIGLPDGTTLRNEADRLIKAVPVVTDGSRQMTPGNYDWIQPSVSPEPIRNERLYGWAHVFTTTAEDQKFVDLLGTRLVGRDAYPLNDAPFAGESLKAPVKASDFGVHQQVFSERPLNLATDRQVKYHFVETMLGVQPDVPQVSTESLIAQRTKELQGTTIRVNGEPRYMNKQAAKLRATEEINEEVATSTLR